MFTGFQWLQLLVRYFLSLSSPLLKFVYIAASASAYYPFPSSILKRDEHPMVESLTSLHIWVITIKPEKHSQGRFDFGEIVWSDGHHYVRIPLVVFVNNTVSVSDSSIHVSEAATAGIEDYTSSVSVDRSTSLDKISIENLRDRKRKIAAMAGAIVMIVGGIASLCVGMEVTTRKSVVCVNIFHRKLGTTPFVRITSINSIFVYNIELLKKESSNRFVSNKMDIPTNWDGTLSSSEFYDSARSLAEKWKVTYPVFPSWSWNSCARPFGCTSVQIQGYLSLEHFFCPKFVEEEIGDAIYEKEEPTSTIKEEPTDDATLAHSYDQDPHFFDLHIVYNISYRVPVLYFRGCHSDGQPLKSNDIEKDLPYHSSKLIKDSRWTFMTLEEHPYLNRPWYLLHPCGTSEWMKLLLAGDASVRERKETVQQYLLSWLSVVGQAVGLRVPLEVYKNLTTPCSVVDVSIGENVFL
ncbi:Ubiquitin-like-conjugating enzyme atg10 [Thalictrum thalictroides]|uniref:Ubiquitin-like-conjugating enzyme ATG10 n=1 Tax=Thalictrum thalictroides TaxID=46969 RepID=A0A7J6XBW9_THATH|nr:Ubiquitin-like-conjugating enzyme atg10 [Thalictrum thalictroides]